VLYAIARPSIRLSVCLSVTRVDQSKTVEVRIMQPSPQSSPVTLVSASCLTVRSLHSQDNHQLAKPSVYTSIGPGCVQFLEISWNLIGPPGNFGVRCRRSTALVSDWVPDHLFKKQVVLFYLCYGPML